MQVKGGERWKMVGRGLEVDGLEADAAGERLRIQNRVAGTGLGRGERG